MHEGNNHIQSNFLKEKQNSLQGLPLLNAPLCILFPPMSRMILYSLVQNKQAENVFLVSTFCVYSHFGSQLDFVPTLDPKNENHDRFGSCHQLVDAPQKILKRKISGFVTHWVPGDVTHVHLCL